MGYGYSVELRERVVSAVRRGVGTHEEIAEIFNVSMSSVTRWLKLDRKEDGVLLPRPHGGGRARLLDGEEAKILIELVEERNDRTIAELCAAMLKRTGKTISTSTLSRELARAGLTRKKKTSARRNP